ncbi:nucleoside diphosphate kinase regulator [Martelella mediterranea]|uniref:Regulator of nucleoside diphosphate kinase n=1 Tax=Martelella mediterranea TaxID=293089 RepID=A0A4R3NKQ8_9HYPH|nr:nucleoside diphosphate kinase regulator [Martelella mediterranea]TCT34707.1 regulator of nucleoside diphosphate kinase [Martelella mediterranea]
MTSKKKKLGKPAIVLAKTDHKRLSLLAERFAEQNADLADFLISELERARIVDDKRIASDVVRMGSSIHFTTDIGDDRQVTLVYPGNADIAEARISVLTPIGAALIGLKAGHSIDWYTRDGRLCRLKVEAVSQPPSLEDE